MNIVVLDGYTLNPGDLSWNDLQSLGSCTVYDRTDAAEIIHRAQEAQIILTNKTPLTKETINALPDLRCIGVMATGYNVVDISAAKERNIVVTNVPAYGTASVAQTVFALLLELTHRVRLHADLVKYGAWSLQPDFSFWQGELIELGGKTMGIVGYGNIGKAVVQIASGFGMNVIVSTRTMNPAGGDVRFVDIDTLFKTSDVISLHCSLTEETKLLVNAQRLARMKRTAFLINTSRGALVDETALADALNNERIAGAGLDVLSTEPPPNDHPLFSAKNCLITPHYAWATLASRKRLMDTVIENVRAFLNGRLINVVV
ncbi:MAG: D-2-hydroxyacid dehydrogenase [Ignavibacteriales bacterium]|nr:D-2-hydroxyacid dehydrogenase [Ignavibacteriales bacterium]